MTQKQFVVVEDAELLDDQFVGRIKLVNEDGSPWSPGGGSSPVSWGEVTGKPSTFPPAEHTHEVSDIDGLQAIIDDLQSKVAALESGGD